MKLLQINTVINFNATGRIAEELGKVALSKGIESYIAFGRNRRPSHSTLVKIGNDWSFKFHVLLSRLFDRHGSGSKIATKKLIRRIIEIKPDIIHLHNVHGYYLNLKILFDFLAESNLPVVWTLHDCWTMTGHCAYFDYVGCQKWKTTCFDCPQKGQYPKSWIIDRSKQNFLEKKQLFCKLKNLTIVSVSNWHASLVRESFLKDYPLQVIHNGLDLGQFKPTEGASSMKRKLNIPDEKFILLGVASVWEPRKGFKDFLQLSQLVDKDTILVMVGLDDSQMKQLPQNMHGIARTENIEQLVDLYTCADMFLNLTYEDNFPTTNLEALACGTPVLTYRTGGSVESVSTGTGFIVEKGDFNGILDAIQEVRKNKKESYIDACRTRAETLYDQQDCYRSYIQLYERMVF